MTLEILLSLIPLHEGQHRVVVSGLEPYMLGWGTGYLTSLGDRLLICKAEWLWGCDCSCSWGLL